MKRYGDEIPNKVLKEIFPRKLAGHEAPEELYTHLKKMILSGKLRKGQRLLRWKFVQIFDVSEWTVMEAFSKLRKDGLVIIKGGGGSFVA